jgi:hypothetical protein
MSKQTAVQILVESMTTSDVSFYSKEIAIALQMEREQIKSTFRDAQIFEVKDYPITDVQYYNETYGGQDE